MVDGCESSWSASKRHLCPAHAQVKVHGSQDNRLAKGGVPSSFTVAQVLGQDSARVLFI